MKSLIKLFFIFFAMFVSICLNSQIEFNTELQSINYIQNDYQKVVMVSNSVRTGEVLNNEKDDNPNSLNNNETPLELALLINSDANNTTRINYNSIHKLSTNSENQISIRAP